LSEPNTAETKIDDVKEPANPPCDETDELDENPPKSSKKSLPKPDPAGLFTSAPLLDQLEMQVSLLTSAMSENMVLATGAFPGLTEVPDDDGPKMNAWLHRKASPTKSAWAEARSLHLRDAARLSFATASLIGAYTKLKGPPVQRFTTRHTTIPDPAGRKKPRNITTITHHLIPLPGGKSAPERADARETQQG